MQFVSLTIAVEVAENFDLNDEAEVYRLESEIQDRIEAKDSDLFTLIDVSVDS